MIHSVPLRKSELPYFTTGLILTPKKILQNAGKYSVKQGVTAQKSRSHTAVRISPLGTLDVFVLEPKNLADVRRLSQMPLLCWRCPAEEVEVG